MLLMLAAPAQGAQEQAVEPGLKSAMVRVAFVVRDLERSKRFYREAFGYRVRFEGDISSPANRALLGLKSSQNARFVILQNEHVFGGKRREAAGIGLLAIGGGRMARLSSHKATALPVGSRCWQSKPATSKR
jgi:catechol 2,3-dioxygenase-like lactoylglutathione lyase family enzyme